MTLAEQVTAVADSAWIGKVTQALTKAAVAVMAEADTVDNHDLRVAYAKAVLGNPEVAGQIATYAVSTNTGISSTATATDNDIEFTVNSMFDAFAGVAN